MSVVEYEVVGAVATITLNRPDAMNSFNRALRKDLLETIGKAEADENVRIVILRGEGRGFCAGADLTEERYQPVDVQLETEYKPILLAITEGNKIYIASVTGAAAGIGSALAMSCDMVFMSDDAYIYLAFAAIGLVPDGGSNWHLLNALGYMGAFEAIVEGRKITADECLKLRVANAVVPRDELKDYTNQRAEKLARGAPLAQAAVKRILRKAGSLSLSETMTMEAGEQGALIASEDFKNAVKAFFEKRKPEFFGK
ncbi:MAG: enoyl-CoA hydratase/isomerase family protein [Rhizobiaceae bacterium]|nr:enoyl-CoA hydratase/isomerase family protein [Rhizobiaceae bacterium]